MWKNFNKKTAEILSVRYLVKYANRGAICDDLPAAHGHYLQC